MKTQREKTTRDQGSSNKISSQLIRSALVESFVKLQPWIQAQNYIMFVVYLGAIICSVISVFDFSYFHLNIALWLWFTVLFANFAESLAEGRGKAHADSLKKAKSEIMARLLVGGKESKVLASKLKVGDLVVCEANDTIPGDGDVVEGIATVNESAITGESAPVIRESGGDRSAVTGGTLVVSDRIVVKITADAGSAFLDRMISMVENAKRNPTPNEIALNILLVSLTVLFVIAVLTLKVFATYSEQASGSESSAVSISVLISLLVCLIPTTIGGLLSAIGISGIDRLVKKNVIAKSGKAIEAAGDIDVLLLDKTGTITLGNRVASELIPAAGVSMQEFAAVAQLASMSDETPEGRSIVVLVKNQFGLRSQNILDNRLSLIPFSAETRMSGVDIVDDNEQRRCIRKGAVPNVINHIKNMHGNVDASLIARADEVAKKGATPLLVAQNEQCMGIVVLKDTVKGGIKERFAELRKMGIRTVMITGDNPLTAASIAAEAGVDDFIAEATPEAKLSRIRSEQSKGHMVGMIGDGTNDAPALAQADVGVAMNTGTQAAREAGNMVDLDSNPTKLIEIVETGKQLLITRGALTTFSIANDIAKYFAILPAIFAYIYISEDGHSALSMFNIMDLKTPQSAVLSSVIFNALVIIALIPLALRGVKFRAIGAERLLKRNLLIYGLGGVVVPFIGIKVIDIIINVVGL